MYVMWDLFILPFFTTPDQGFVEYTPVLPQPSYYAGRICGSRTRAKVYSCPHHNPYEVIARS